MFVIGWRCSKQEEKKQLSVSLTAFYNSLRVVFIYFDTLSFSSHVNFVLLHLSAYSHHLTPVTVWFYVDGLAIFSALSAPQCCLLALFSALSLSFHVIFPVYLVSSLNLPHSWILLFFLLAGAHCPDTYSNRPVFITGRSKVWAKHWLFWCWEQNGMDFHLHSKMWLQRRVRVFIRWGQEVIHHSTTWEHLTNPDRHPAL